MAIVTKKMNLNVGDAGDLWKMIDQVLKLVNFPGAHLSDIKFGNEG